MEDSIRPLRIWNDGELREFDTVTVGDRRLAVVRPPRLESRSWALPGGFSDAGTFPVRNMREMGEE
jgi:ADP-ribose pyrophosphatase YjhB (NUDIX family)